VIVIAGAVRSIVTVLVFVVEVTVVVPSTDFAVILNVATPSAIAGATVTVAVQFTGGKLPADGVHTTVAGCPAMVAVVAWMGESFETLFEVLFVV
jgi:hypothetical protein